MVSLPKLSRAISEPRKNFSVAAAKFPLLKTNKKIEPVIGEIKLNIISNFLLKGVKTDKQIKQKLAALNNKKDEKKILKVVLKQNDSKDPLKRQPVTYNHSTTLNSIIRKVSSKNEFKQPTNGIKIIENSSRVSFNDEIVSVVQDDSSTSLLFLDSLKYKYSNNPTLERRETITKLNRFKKKCSIALAKTTESVEIFESIKKKKASVKFESPSDNKPPPVNNGPHFGSCLSFDGQFATLSGIEDLVKSKLKAKLDEIFSENTTRLKFRAYKNDKKQEIINELKEILANNDTANNDSPQQQKNENNGYQNPFRKALISKYIQDGLSLLDEINKFLKTNFSQIAQEEIKIQESVYSFDYDSSNSKSDDINLIDTNLSKTQELANKFKDWKLIWSTAF
jgi:hypothetical protein